MFFTIIINTCNQENYIKRCIDSCLNQNFDSNLYEIIVTDTSDKKYLSTRFNNPKLRIIESDKFSSYPCIDQMFSIKKAIDYSCGKNICLLDGDDFFSLDKLKNIHKHFVLKDKFVNQDNIVGFSEKEQCNIKINNEKKYKNNFLYKKLFNNWPTVMGTSSITISSNLLKDFFSKINPKKWEYLAIDALICIYFQKYNCIYNYGNNLTFKSFHDKNLDSTFSDKFSRKFWKRRYLQHQYYQEINKKKYFNIDFLFAKLFS